MVRIAHAGWAAGTVAHCLVRLKRDDEAFEFLTLAWKVECTKERRIVLLRPLLCLPAIAPRLIADPCLDVAYRTMPSFQLG